MRALLIYMFFFLNRAITFLIPSVGDSFLPFICSAILKNIFTVRTTPLIGFHKVIKVAV
jgi:hypothetical protein